VGVEGVESRVSGFRFQVWRLVCRVGGFTAVDTDRIRISAICLVWGLGFTVHDLGFGVKGFGLGVSGVGVRVKGLGCRVSGLGSRVRV